MSNEQIFGIVFASLVVFVLIREVICWYFKINERVKLLVKIDQKQQITNDYLAIISSKK